MRGCSVISIPTSQKSSLNPNDSGVIRGGYCPLRAFGCYPRVGSDQSSPEGLSHPIFKIRIPGKELLTPTLQKRPLKKNLKKILPGPTLWKIRIHRKWAVVQRGKKRVLGDISGPKCSKKCNQTPIYKGGEFFTAKSRRHKVVKTLI